MGYAKKKFNSQFESYLNTISSYGQTSIKQVDSYTPIADTVRGFYWEGETKDAICVYFDDIDAVCSGYFLPETMQLVAKTKIVYEVLYPDLQALKNLIEQYNKIVDDIAELESQIAQEKTKIGKEGAV